MMHNSSRNPHGHSRGWAVPQLRVSIVHSTFRRDPCAGEWRANHLKKLDLPGGRFEAGFGLEAMP
jgi:hypothetical protein